MENISKYMIRADELVLDALKYLNNFNKTDALTLFVIREDGKMIGSLTDGDIRRKLVEKHSLSEPVANIMHKEFCFLRKNDINVKNIRFYKDKGISLIPVLDQFGCIDDIINLKMYKSYLPIDVVLMAGGKGERLRPLTEKIPKPLLKVGNKAIIDYNIEKLISYGVKHISVTVNYLKEQIETHFSQKTKGVQVKCVREPKYLGTIGSVNFVDAFYNDAILVMNSDLFTNIDYEDFYIHFVEHDADMSIAAVPYSVSIPYGVLDLEGRSVRGIHEKPTYNYYANAGIYLIKRDLLQLIPEDTFFNATDLIELLIHYKKKVVRFPIAGYWIDIGKHEDYRKAEELVKHLYK